MENFLKDHNFSVTNLDYPSRKFTIPELAEQIRRRIRKDSKAQNAEKGTLRYSLDGWNFAEADSKNKTTAKPWSNGYAWSSQ